MVVVVVVVVVVMVVVVVVGDKINYKDQYIYITGYIIDFNKPFGVNISTRGRSSFNPSHSSFSSYIII